MLILEWINTDDLLPVNGQRVLCVQNPITTATKEPLFAIFLGGDFRPPMPNIFADYEIGITKYIEITHWMPLPPTPKD